MKLLKLGVFLSMLLMTPVLEAQNTSAVSYTHLTLPTT